MKRNESKLTRRWMGVLLMGALSCNGYAADGKERVEAEYTFDTKEELADWVMEGDGMAYIQKGELILEPQYYSLMDSLMDAGTVSTRNEVKEYNPFLYVAMKAKHGTDIQHYVVEEKGKATFSGGHFNFWNRRVRTGQDFAIEFDFRSLSPAPLHMLMFCASGKEGQSIFTPSLLPRYGIGKELMYDLSMYRLSFFNKHRGTANLRRAPGRAMAAKGKDIVSQEGGKTYHCRVERVGKTVRFWVNGEECLSYVDEHPLKGNEWGFRLMVCAKGAYDNIRVITIDKE